MPRHLSFVPANAGDMSETTVALRAPLKLTQEQRDTARTWRTLGLEFWEIAEEMGLPEQDVAHALANMRTKRLAPPRVSLNVSVAAAERVKALQRPGEAMWQTVNRLLGIT